MRNVLDLINKHAMKLIAMCLFITLVFIHLENNYQKDAERYYSNDNSSYLHYKEYRF